MKTAFSYPSDRTPKRKFNDLSPQEASPQAVNYPYVTNNLSSPYERSDLSPWDFQLLDLKRFKAIHGHCRVPISHRSLYEWLKDQREVLLDPYHAKYLQDTLEWKQRHNQLDSLYLQDVVEIQRRTRDLQAVLRTDRQWGDHMGQTQAQGPESRRFNSDPANLISPQNSVASHEPESPLALLTKACIQSKPIDTTETQATQAASIPTELPEHSIPDTACSPKFSAWKQQQARYPQTSQPPLSSKPESRRFIQEYPPIAQVSPPSPYHTKPPSRLSSAPSSHPPHLAYPTTTLRPAFEPSPSLPPTQHPTEHVGGYKLPPIEKLLPWIEQGNPISIREVRVLNRTLGVSTTGNKEKLLATLKQALKEMRPSRPKARELPPLHKLLRWLEMGHHISIREVRTVNRKLSVSTSGNKEKLMGHMMKALRELESSGEKKE